MWYTTHMTGRGTEGIVDGTRGMKQLSAWLQREVAARKGGVREIEELTGVAKSTINRIVNGTQKTPPSLDTLVRLSDKLGQPLIDLVEWSGLNPGLPAEDDALVRRLQAEALTDPQLAEILALLRVAPDQDRKAVLTYLRGALGTR